MNASQRHRLPFIVLGSFLFVVLIGMACNLPAGLQERLYGSASTASPTLEHTYTPQPLPPTVIETDPPLGSTLSLDGSVTLYFNQKMDRASVEGAISFNPDLDVKWIWRDDSILTLQPETGFSPGKKQVIILGHGAAGKNGLLLSQPVQLSFFTPDLLKPVTFLPVPGSVEIDPSSVIVVTFNQPIIELGETNQDLPPGFFLSPATVGEGNWINTSTYQFIPANGLSGGVTYQAELNTELLSTAGAGFAPDVINSWSFSTSYPQVLSWDPYDGEAGVPLDTSIELIFNQSMDPKSVEAGFSLVDSSGEEVIGTLEWSDDFTNAEFQPGQLLERNNSYAAILPGEVLSSGKTPLQLDTSWYFQTSGEFVFLGTPTGLNYTPSIYEGITLYFSNPVNLETVLDNIGFVPEVENLRPSIGGSRNVLNIYGDFEPLENYLLTINESLTDEWGDDLGITRSLAFTTAPLPPNLVVTQGTNILFLTGSENAIPAQVTNLYQVSINVGSIPDRDYPLFFGSGVYQTLDTYYPEGLNYINQIVNVRGDESYTVNLPLNQAGSVLPPGLYRYQIQSQELPYNPSPYLLAVSDIHLTMKTSPEDILIWAVDLNSGAPLIETDIIIYRDNGEVFLTGRTDQQGIFQADFSEPMDLYDTVFYAVTGQPGEENFGITASNWASGTEPYQFGLISNYGAPQPQTYIYTDRPIYRPGQTVHFHLIHRSRETGDYVLPTEESITVTLYEDGGNTREVDLPLTEFGTAKGEFSLSSQATPGYYRLETEHGMVLFQVAEYRKPEINIALSFEKAESILGADWNGNVNAQYYFNAPADNSDLTWTLRAERSYFNLPGYQVGRINSNWFTYPAFSPFTWGTVVDTGEGKTDGDGNWSTQGEIINLDIYDREIVLPANYIFSVTFQDETGFQVSNQTEMLVHPADFYIGVNPSAWFVEANQQVQFQVMTVDWDKEPDGNRSLKAELNKVTWNYQVGEIGQVEYTKEIEKIAERSFSTNRNGEATIDFIPPSPGNYQIDIFGGGARTEVSLWVGGPGTVTWPTQSNQKLKLVTNQETFLPGDDATVFIPNPFPEGAEALITIERHKVIDYQLQSISGSGETIVIPLSEDEVPNVYVSVTLIGKDEEGRMDFRQGYQNLLVEPINKLLKVDIIGEPELLGPGEEVEFRIRVTDLDGNPIEGELSLAVVDLAIFALADPNSPEIQEAFYGVQPLAVRMGFPLGVHAGRNVFIPGGLGGGGGSAVEPFLREEFKDTAYWQADIETDRNGLAQVKVSLPDNLTTWQAKALGVTVETEVGQGSTEVVTTKELLIRPVTPRFLVVGDHLAFGAVVHNNTEKDLIGDVSIQSTGIQLDLPEYSTQTVEIPAGSRTRVEWWGTVEDATQAELIFSVDTGELQDAVKPYQGDIPVYRYTSPQTFGTSGILTDEGSQLEIISLPKSYDSSQGSLDVELSPSLAAIILTALDAHEQDPRLSNDSLVSYFLPNVVTYYSLNELDIDFPSLENRLSEIIPTTLDILEASQNEDGGWGWWEGGASDPEITSYILFGLSKAQQSGVFVAELMIQQARGYLLATMPSVDMLNESWQFNQLAMRYFALTESGIDVSAGMLSMVPIYSQISPAYQALLAVSLESQLPGNEHSTTILSNLAGQAIRTSTGAHWENPEDCRCWFYNTITTTAMINYALASVEGFPDILPEAVRYLVSNLTPTGDWGSPFETSWSILALNEVISKSGELSADYQYSSMLNSRELITGEVDGSVGLEAVTRSVPVDMLYADDPNALSISRTDGDGKLYYKAHLFVHRPAEDVQPFGKGINLSRVFRQIDSEDENQFVQSGHVGDLIEVRLNLVVENDLHYVIVEDLIPSGAEILDTRLNTSRQDLEEYQIGNPFNNGWGWWYFNSPTVYDNRVVWAANYLPAGTYQLVYTISLTHPGEYQVLPARAWQQYFPETQAISGGDKFVVEAAY